MKTYLILFIAFLMGCQKEVNTDTSCFTLSERQCAMDPYQSYVHGKEYTSKSKGITAWLSSKGVSNATVVENAPYTGAVCLACSCPSGISYTITVSSTDTFKLKELDLVLVKKDCN